MNYDEIEFEGAEPQIVLLETLDSRSTALEIRLRFKRVSFGSTA